jgi:hypothetical protein
VGDVLPTLHAGLTKTRLYDGKYGAAIATALGSRLPITTGTELWFIVSPMTFYLRSMATCMPIQFSSGCHPIR